MEYFHLHGIQCVPDDIMPRRYGTPEGADDADEILVISCFRKPIFGLLGAARTKGPAGDHFSDFTSSFSGNFLFFRHELKKVNRLSFVG